MGRDFRKPSQWRLQWDIQFDFEPVADNSEHYDYTHTECKLSADWNGDHYEFTVHQFPHVLGAGDWRGI